MSSQLPQGIQSISKNDIHRITSGQVVLDIQSAVKELVENALDAGARAIEIRFKEYGADAIEVIDNGSGIRAENYESLALKHHTSKLSSFQDLTSVKTFGFRGEALSSLCELCKVQVVTATKEEEPVGTVLEFNRDGTIKSQDRKLARQRGTTVTLEDLFVTLPVRRRELLKNIKREFAKAQALLQAYAIISKGVRWVVSNTVKGRRTNSMTISGSNTVQFLQSNVSAVFGPKAGTSLIPMDLRIVHEEGRIKSKRRVNHHALPDAETLDQEEEEDEEEEEGGGGDELLLKGLISRPTHGSGRTSSDRIFLYLNGRPWDSTRIVRAFNEVYKSFNSHQCPMVVADFTVDGDKYDVNVSPDKRTLFLHDESEIIEGLKTVLEEYLSPFQSTFTVNGANLSAAKDALLQSQLAFKKSHTNSSGNDRVEARPSTSPSDITRPIQVSDTQDEDEEGHVNLRSRKRPRLEQLEETQDTSMDSPSEGEEEDELDEESIRASQNEYGTESAQGRISETVQVTSQLDQRSEKWIPPRRTGRNASQATIEAKLTGPASPSKKWRESLRAFAGGAGSSDVITSGEVEADGDEEPGDGLEYTEAGLTAEQEEEGEQQRQAYKDEAKQGNISVLASQKGEEDEEKGDFEESSVLQLREAASDEQEEQVDDVALGRANEMIRHVDKAAGRLSIQVDIDAMRARLEQRSRLISSSGPARELEKGKNDDFDHAGVDETDAEAVEMTLNRTIDKQDFASMQIIGQFNLGFILARRRVAESYQDDIFIIDQHAADEKYNFEMLQRDTKLKAQHLIQPRLLELPSSVEMIAAQHVETLAAHGFLIRVNEEAMPGSRVHLLALPISKNTTFGVSDLEELLHRLADVNPASGRAQSIRCSKLHNMLASRACRKSIMVGRALTERQMKQVLQHMGEIEQPWNCPHGRPTMRHLHQLHIYPDSEQQQQAEAKDEGGEKKKKKKGERRTSIKWQSLL